MAHLVIMVGKKHERTIELDVQRLVIGRGDEAGLQLQNEVVSRQHCAVESEGTRHVLVDLKSTSGTFVGGEAFQPVTVSLEAASQRLLVVPRNVEGALLEKRL